LVSGNKLKKEKEESKMITAKDILDLVVEKEEKDEEKEDRGQQVVKAYTREEDEKDDDEKDDDEKDDDEKDDDEKDKDEKSCQKLKK